MFEVLRVEFGFDSKLISINGFAVIPDSRLPDSVEEV
jgi:hypothetical protein